MKTASRRAALLLAVWVGAMAFAGCASSAGLTGAGEPTAGALSTATPSVTPTAACPEQPGVELPPGCAGYDPEQAMAQNDRHRQRTGSVGDPAASSAGVAAAESALEGLVASGAPVSADGVSGALSDAGLSEVQVREDYGRVLFGTAAPGGGCIFGEVGPPVRTDSDQGRPDESSGSESSDSVSSDSVSGDSESGGGAGSGEWTVRVEAGGFILDGGCLPAN